MAMKGILVDYEFCSGCQACMMACQVEFNLPKGHEGIVVHTVGPWTIDAENDVYQYDYFPLLTDECSLCAERTAKGKLPTCVKHCLAAVMTYGEVSELARKLEDKPKQMLLVPKHQN